MRSVRALFTASAILLLSGRGVQAGPAHTLGIGDEMMMSEVKLKNVDDRELTIADVAGEKGTLVLFSCNACPWVKAWEERIAALGNGYQKRGIGVIAINSNDPEVVPADGFEEMKKRAHKRGFKFPYVVDASSKVARAFGATRTPEAFLFDGERRLVYHGTIDDNAHQPAEVEQHYLRDALEALLAGKGVSIQETKALGCRIKFRPEA